MILNVRPKSIKLLRQKMGNFHDFGFDNYFLDMILKAQTTKIKTDKMEFIEIKKSLLYIKKHYKKVQRRSI